MGQKINPTGFRLSVNKNWQSKWYAKNKDFAHFVAEDLRIRQLLQKRLANASVSKIMIERPDREPRITICSARPGVVIGKRGEGIEALRVFIQQQLGVKAQLDIEEVRKPEIDAQLVAENLAQQLEKRVMFRRGMKRAVASAQRLGIKGIKIVCSGRLNGIEIARSEKQHEGKVPLHTLRADIDYGFHEAKTTYGIIGVKVWIYHGEVAIKKSAH